MGHIGKQNCKNMQKKTDFIPVTLYPAFLDRDKEPNFKLGVSFLELKVQPLVKD